MMPLSVTTPSTAIAASASSRYGNARERQVQPHSRRYGPVKTSPLSPPRTPPGPAHIRTKLPARSASRFSRRQAITLSTSDATSHTAPDPNLDVHATSASSAVPQHTRRAALISGASAPVMAALAACAAEPSEPSLEEAPPIASAPTPSPQVYFDVVVDGERTGRIVMEPSDSVAGERLLALARGEARGDRFISFLRRVEMVDINAEGGYASTAPIEKLQTLEGGPVEDIPGGPSARGLRDALAEQQRGASDGQDGSVWLKVFDSEEQANSDLVPSQKLVSRNGKFEIETQEVLLPNGTSIAFCASQCTPVLSKTHALAGRVVSGGEVVRAILELDTVAVNRKLQYGSNLADIAAPRQMRPFKKTNLKAGVL